VSFLQIVQLLPNFICNLFLLSITIFVGEVISMFYKFIDDCKLEKNHGCLVSSQYSINIKENKFINASIPDIIVVN